ncbi:hypothetical protein O7626_02560 [Micromonospora sp. WMMD1102]|uniref:hypothetical protein n=1 Tax=Micromonospora sp. WMMD1102 TaxID=3016105 RepID=UPI002414E083|nr:hypothetical protein [Micromonospora sp. WMMD1102]MDG4784824.1 hypothetical protein [Micromonospora sp. WMMD1102]
MEKVAQPGPVLAVLLISGLIAAGWLAPRYVADPTTIAGPARYVVAAGLAVIAFLSFSTLNLVAYCLIVTRQSEPTKRFVSAVGNRAAIGAILGTLLGLRMASMMGDRPVEDPAVQPTTFLDFESNLSNTITLVTLALIGTAWPYCWGPVRASMTAFASKPPLAAHAGKLGFALGATLLLSSHFLGFGVALAVYRGVANP